MFPLRLLVRCLKLREGWTPNLTQNDESQIEWGSQIYAAAARVPRHSCQRSSKISFTPRILNNQKAIIWVPLKKGGPIDSQIWVNFDITPCNLGGKEFWARARAVVWCLMMQMQKCHQVRRNSQNLWNIAWLNKLCESVPGFSASYVLVGSYVCSHCLTQCNVWGRALGSFNLCPQWHVVTWLIPTSWMCRDWL